MTKRIIGEKYEISVSSGGKYRGNYLKKNSAGNACLEYIFKNTLKWDKKKKEWVDEGVDTHTVLKKTISNIIRI